MGAACVHRSVVSVVLVRQQMGSVAHALGGERRARRILNVIILKNRCFHRCGRGRGFATGATSAFPSLVGVSSGRSGVAVCATGLIDPQDQDGCGFGY